MTSRAVATEAQIRRAIKAAQKEGLPIAGIRPDGTIIIGEPPILAATSDHDFWLDPAKWNGPNNSAQKK
jgi:hypothetical protein